MQNYISILQLTTSAIIVHTNQTISTIINVIAAGNPLHGSYYTIYMNYLCLLFLLIEIYLRLAKSGAPTILWYLGLLCAFLKMKVLLVFGI